ncbi:hypothetical protein NKR23_g4659 [Pleurostoma richardsiae]|uniref:Uncharacterized protein n=1 Tax=Pleurostoma richardsiae TaxID=41990 RepID=A0AA38RVV0_9PEZI|nr:hypothetical protein NKR23_g4659 [Pleurostoma richardsiae]
MDKKGVQLKVGSLYIMLTIPASALVDPKASSSNALSARFHAFCDITIPERRGAKHLFEELLYWDIYIHKSETGGGTVYRVSKYDNKQTATTEMQLDVREVENVRDLSHVIGLAKVVHLAPTLVPAVDEVIRLQKDWSKGACNSCVWTFTLLNILDMAVNGEPNEGATLSLDLYKDFILNWLHGMDHARLKRTRPGAVHRLDCL